jgi:hypothetical protein
MPSMNKCDHCGGKFGLIRHRWWGQRFCSIRCYDVAETVRNRVRSFLNEHDQVRGADPSSSST